MMILTDFYLAFAIVLVASAGGLVVWQIGLKPPNKQLLVIAAFLFALAGLIGIGSMIYYGGSLTHEQGECPYSEPMVPCPTTPPEQLSENEPDYLPPPE